MRLLLSSLALLVPGLPQSSPAEDFAEEVRRIEEALEAQGGTSEERLAEGRCEEASRVLIDLVPESDRTAAHHFALGHLLAPIDPGLSRRFHRLAYEGKPEEPLVLLEWALEVHRSGRYAEAEALYRGLLEGSGAGHPRFHALRADCLLRLGRTGEALEAWGRSSPGRFRAEIEETLSWIRPKPSPWARRCALLARIRSGGADGIEPLILLDLEWDAEGSGPRRNEGLLSRDVPLAKGTFGAESRRWRLLDLLVRAPDVQSPEASEGPSAARNAELLERFLREKEAEDPSPRRLSRDDLEVQLRTHRVIGPSTALPESSATARALFGRILDLGMASPERLLLDFEAPLRERTERGAGDVEALRLLAVLYERAGNPRLAEADRIGWEKHRDPRCAERLLARRAQTLRSDDPLLEGALREVPEEPRILALAVECARREGKPLQDLLAKQVLAQFARLESWGDLAGSIAALEEEVPRSRKEVAATQPR